MQIGLRRGKVGPDLVGGSFETGGGRDGGGGEGRGDTLSPSSAVLLNPPPSKLLLLHSDCQDNLPSAHPDQIISSTGYTRKLFHCYSIRLGSRLGSSIPQKVSSCKFWLSSFIGMFEAITNKGSYKKLHIPPPPPCFSELFFMLYIENSGPTFSIKGS